MQAIAGLVMGMFVGLLIGLSTSPVVGAVVSTVVASVGAIVSIGVRFRGHHVIEFSSGSELRSALFFFAATVFVVVGILLRTNGVLGVDPIRDLYGTLRAVGFEEADARGLIGRILEEDGGAYLGQTARFAASSVYTGTGSGQCDTIDFGRLAEFEDVRVAFRAAGEPWARAVALIVELPDEERRMETARVVYAALCSGGN